MTECGAPAMRRALEAAVSGSPLTRNLGSSVWLYLVLLLAANHRGLVIRTREHLAAALAAREKEIDIWLSRLSIAGLIELKSPAPYLVVSLRFWSGSASVAAPQSGQRSAGGGLPGEEVPVGSKQPAAEQTKSSGDGGPGEGEKLLLEAKAMLGETDTADLPELIASHQPPIVRRALQRVRATPERQIRRSRVALFRFLLTKFSEEDHVHPPTHHPDNRPPAP